MQKMCRYKLRVLFLWQNFRNDFYMYKTSLNIASL